MKFKIKFKPFSLMFKYIAGKIKGFIQRHEFSKMFCGLIATVIGVIGVYSIIRYYALCNKAIEMGSDILPDVTLAVTCVSVLLGAFLSYCLYQFGLKNSRNKYGVDVNGQPFEDKEDEAQEEEIT